MRLIKSQLIVRKPIGRQDSKLDLLACDKQPLSEISKF